MGNLVSLLQDHSLGDQVASGGPGNIWKIYDAKRRSNNEAVTLFVFDKSILEKYPSVTREAVINSLRNEVRHLTKLRHPRVISILRAEQETKRAIVIETEPIFCSLSNMLRDFTNVKPPQAIREFEAEPLEIKIGIMQIAEGLDFLHNTANIIHHNITPSAIYITKKGDWKLGGFNFSAYANYKPGTGKPLTLKEFNVKKEQFHIDPDLDYIAPECIITKQYDYASDMFSLGCVIYHIYTKQKIHSNSNNILTYKHSVENIHRATRTTNSLPLELQDILDKLLAVNPRQRPDIKQFLASEYFEDINIQSIAFLATLMEIDNSKKAAFFKGFFTVIGNFTPRIIESKILPPLLQELKNAIQIPFILPILIELIKKLSTRTFQLTIFPHLIPLLQAYESPNNALLIANLPLLLSKLTPPLIEQKILPIIFSMLEGQNARFQDVVIKQIPELCEHFDYSVMKAKFLPRLVALVSSDGTNSTVRLNGLICFNKLIPTMDKGTIMESVLPVLEQICRNPSVGFLTPIFHCYSALALQLGPFISCTRLLPFIVPLCSLPDISPDQFELLLTVIKALVKATEDWRHLEFKAKKEVEKHMEEKHEEEFVAHQNFENLVNAEFGEQHRRNLAHSSSYRQVTSQAPPPPETVNSFDTLIQQEEEARKRQMQPSQQHQQLIDRLGGHTVAPVTSSLKQLNITDAANRDHINFGESSSIPQVSTTPADPFGSEFALQPPAKARITPQVTPQRVPTPTSTIPTTNRAPSMMTPSSTSTSSTGGDLLIGMGTGPAIPNFAAFTGVQTQPITPSLQPTPTLTPSVSLTPTSQHYQPQQLQPQSQQLQSQSQFHPQHTTSINQQSNQPSLMPTSNQPTVNSFSMGNPAINNGLAGNNISMMNNSNNNNNTSVSTHDFGSFNFNSNNTFNNDFDHQTLGYSANSQSQQSMSNTGAPFNGGNNNISSSQPSFTPALFQPTQAPSIYQPQQQQQQQQQQQYQNSTFNNSTTFQSESSFTSPQVQPTTNFNFDSFGDFSSNSTNNDNSTPDDQWATSSFSTANFFS